MLITANMRIVNSRDRAAGWVSYGQKWKTGTAWQTIFTVIIGLASTIMA